MRDVGSNGAGKSTLMRTIATLQEPDEGTIVFEGHDIVKSPALVRGKLGYLPQQFGVYPRIPALDLLDHIAVLKGLSNRRERREQIDALPRLTNLWDVRNRAVSTFSGGMRQRFGIAQALLAALLFFASGFVLSATGFGPRHIAVDSPWTITEAMGLASSWLPVVRPSPPSIPMSGASIAFRPTTRYRFHDGITAAAWNESRSESRWSRRPRRRLRARRAHETATGARP